MVVGVAFDLERVETPCWIVNLGSLRRNAELLQLVSSRAQCRILLALKGYATWSTFPLLKRYLHGVAASSPHEARLGREEFGKEVHVYAPAYSPSSLADILRYADHVVFNSVGQLQRFGPLVGSARPRVGRGLRVNPEHSEVAVEAYDPCARYSRLGVTLNELGSIDLSELDGLHFHTLCEKDADALERTLRAVEARFGGILKQVRWVNFGGGHHVTREGYDVELLVALIRNFRAAHGVEVYLEPGEAVALNAGVLVASVLDVIQNEIRVAILDTSAAAHMPDVLEMPYRPEIAGAGRPGEYAHTYRLGGLTCLAGDVIGDYSFPAPLAAGDKLVFSDMAHYSMVKSTTFNGLQLPSIVTYEPTTGQYSLVRRFDYENFKSRLS
ncbi:carboxynorspermidine decarboxylase [Myxococcota bacterium]